MSNGMKFYDVATPVYEVVEVSTIAKPSKQEIPKKLMRKIRDIGRVVVPVVLRFVNTHYEVLEGKKRILACIELGIDTVPSVVYGPDDEVPTDLGVVLNETHRGNRHDTYLAVYRLYVDEEKEAPEISRILGLELATTKRYIRDVSQHPELVSEWMGGKLSTTLLKKLALRPREEQVIAAALLEAKGALKQGDLENIRRVAADDRERRQPSIFALPEIGDVPYVSNAKGCGDGALVTVLINGTEREIRVPVEKIMECEMETA